MKQQNGKETPIQQAIIRFADDIHTTTEYLTTLMKLKMKGLKKQLMEKEGKSPNYVPPLADPGERTLRDKSC